MIESCEFPDSGLNGTERTKAVLPLVVHGVRTVGRFFSKCPEQFFLSCRKGSFKAEVVLLFLFEHSPNAFLELLLSDFLFSGKGKYLSGKALDIKWIGLGEFDNPARNIPRAFFIASLESLDDKSYSSLFRKRGQLHSNRASVKWPALFFEHVEQHSTSAAEKKPGTVRLMLDMFAQQGLDLVAVPQFGDLLKFIEYDVGLLGITGKKSVKAFESLFKESKPGFLTGRLNGNGNTAVRLRSEVGAPVFDEAQGLFQ